MASSLIIAFFILAFNTLPAASWPNAPPYQGTPSFWPSSDPIMSFYKCVNSTTRSQIKFSQGFYDPNYDKASFTTILNSTAENLRCLSQNIQKPKSIFTPSNQKQVQAAVQCAPINGFNIRVRSGGHDYEGLSYISYTCQPFIIVDLRNFNKVDINIEDNSAWVEAGVTVGALYYLISQKSNVHGFPAGLCTDLGIGGHMTGGAYGSMLRKYGLGIDHALDAVIVNAWGQILNRQTMGEDLFWAIRGGGGGNFGIILSWKIQLVAVPEKVTFFSIPVVGPGSKKGMKILQKWQTVAPTIDNDLFIRVIMLNGGPSITLNIYQGLYLGRTNELLKVMKRSFPELGLLRANCTEMSWIESVIAVAGFQPPIAPKDLLKGQGAFLNYFKAKSDFVTSPISEKGLVDMFRIFGEDVAAGLMVWTPYGGKMFDIPEDATAYPHRNVLFKIQYVANWNEDNPKLQLDHETWIRKLYDYMKAHVSKDPRQAYVNYRDLDIGKPDPSWNCSDPSIWGPKYYKGNFQRLVQVKARVDHLNVFNNEQSIPPPYTPYGRCIWFDTNKG